jgi:hypothetical protein
MRERLHQDFHNHACTGGPWGFTPGPSLARSRDRLGPRSTLDALRSNQVSLDAMAEAAYALPLGVT